MRIHTIALLLVLAAGAARGITVQDSAGLVNGLNAAAPGDTLLLAAGRYGVVTLKNRFSGPVVVAAADPAARPVFTRLVLSGAANLVFGHLAFQADSSLVTDTAASAVLVRMIDDKSKAPCSTVTFNHCTFYGVITDAGSASLDGYAAHVDAFGGDASGVDGLSVYACEFTRIYSGIALTLRDAYIGFNNFHHVRSDPVRAYITGAVIENNIFYYPAGRHGADGTGDHGSVLDIRGMYDVTIRNNYCNQAGGAWTNAFALQAYGIAEQGHVIVDNNIIYDANSKCLAIRGLPHSVVSNNLVLYNHYDIKKPPTINVTGVAAESVTVINNIAPAYVYDDTLLTGFGLVTANNLRVQRDDPAADWYYGDLFAGAMDDSAATFESFTLLPGALDTFAVRPGVDYTKFTQIAMWAVADTGDSSGTGISVPFDDGIRALLARMPAGWYDMTGRFFPATVPAQALAAGVYVRRDENGVRKAVIGK